MAKVNVQNYYCNISSRFKSENNNEDEVEKWTTPIIADMYKIFEDLNIEKVLDDVVDTRKSEISELSKQQLKHECQKLGIPSDGKKVNISS